ALRKAAMNAEAKQFLMESPKLFQLLRKAADRYIGGETLEETIQKVKAQNTTAMKCSIEFMGENVRSIQEANEAADEFVRICHMIHSQKLDSTVSLDLSHIGLELSQDLCLENLDRICKAAGDQIEVIISAEDAEKTDRVLNAYRIASKKHQDLAITLQAYLYRTKEDLASIHSGKGRIRIVKGAFEMPAGISMPRGTELNETYLGYVDQLLATKRKCSIASHDALIQSEASKLVDHYQPNHSMYEFESLYGIQTAQLLDLKNRGYKTKLYFVYGKEWYLYLCNRIAESPMNIFRALADIVTD
ncbi:MAG: proline dehydrogenase family protein, partial [Chitinophagaceae bacterium]|nr:proline dehydrogenase family protein [Chitinophagaceae bacterium]